MDLPEKQTDQLKAPEGQEVVADIPKQLLEEVTPVKGEREIDIL